MSCPSIGSAASSRDFIAYCCRSRSWDTKYHVRNHRESSHRFVQLISHRKLPGIIRDDQCAMRDGISISPHERNSLHRYGLVLPLFQASSARVSASHLPTPVCSRKISVHNAKRKNTNFTMYYNSMTQQTLQYSPSNSVLPTSPSLSILKSSPNRSHHLPETWLLSLPSSPLRYLLPSCHSSTSLPPRRPCPYAPTAAPYTAARPP